MAGSALVPLVNALKAKLLALDPISVDSVPVELQEPPVDDKPQQVVWFGDADSTMEFLAQGPSYQETGELEVFIRVKMPGGTPADQDSARDRAVLLWGVFITALITDPKVSASCRAAWPGSYQTDSEMEPGNVVCMLRGTVNWLHHITS